MAKRLGWSWFIIVASAAASAAPFRIQQTCASIPDGGEGQVLAVKLQLGVTAGDSLVVGVTYPHQASTITLTSLTDDHGDTFTLVDSIMTTSHRTGLWHATARGGGFTTITARSSVDLTSLSAILSVFVAEYAPGLTPTASSRNAGMDSMAVFGPLDRTSVDEVMVGVGAMENGVVQSTGVLGGGFEVLGSCGGDFYVDQLAGATGPSTATLTSSMAFWNIVSARFEVARGVDGGLDAGSDAGVDGGVDGGFDAGTPMDAGAQDAGSERRLQVGSGCATVDGAAFAALCVVLATRRRSRRSFVR